VARLFLDRIPSLVSLERGQGLIALHDACFHGHEKIVRLLLDSGSPIDKAANDGVTPLYSAFYRQQYTVCKLLLDYGASFTWAISGVTENLLKISKHAQQGPLKAIVERLDDISIEDWSVEDVSYFISRVEQEHLLLRGIHRTFRRRKIDGKQLKNLNRSKNAEEKWKEIITWTFENDKDQGHCDLERVIEPHWKERTAQVLMQAVEAFSKDSAVWHTFWKHVNKWIQLAKENLF